MLPSEYLAASDAAITQRLTELPEFVQSKRLFAYCSVKREVDTIRMLQIASDLGKEIYLPVVLGDGIMEFAFFDGLMSLKDGFMSIPEPGADAPRALPQENDVLLVPGVCFDAAGYRLGQGGGYYDRYLTKVNCITVGLARERLMPNAVPREAHDRAVSILLTESREIRQ